MTQAQHTTHQSATVSALSLAAAALAATALVAVAVVITQVGPIRIVDTPARSYAIDGADAWEAQREAVSAATFADPAIGAELQWEQRQVQISDATYGGAIDRMPGVLRRQAPAADAAADADTRVTSPRAPVSR